MTIERRPDRHLVANASPPGRGRGLSVGGWSRGRAVDERDVLRVSADPALDEGAEGHHLAGALVEHLVERVPGEGGADPLALERRVHLRVGEDHELVGLPVLREAGQGTVDPGLPAVLVLVAGHDHVGHGEPPPGSSLSPRTWPSASSPRAVPPAGTTHRSTGRHLAKPQTASEHRLYAGGVGVVGPARSGAVAAPAPVAPHRGPSVTVAFVESAALRVRKSPWVPSIGRPETVLDRVVSGVGATFATWAFAASLLPSLLPRTAWLQGIVSGVTVAVGYGIGAGAHGLWTYLGIPGVRGRPRSVLLTGLVGLGLVAAVLSGWRLVGWQNEIRDMFGMPPTSPMIWPVIVLVTVLIAATGVLLARLLRLGTRTAVSWLARHLPPRLAVVLGVGVLGVLCWGLWTGVIVQGFFAGANAIFAAQDRTGSESTDRPTAPERSGTAGSLSRWEDLGSYGRRFVHGGPTIADLQAVNGPGARMPIRVYAGLKSAATAQGRAELVLAELERTGAFDREVLVVATTTGMGFLDPRGTDPLEYLWNGDTAIAGVQYSHLPSWISLLADQEAVVETSRAVFETVRARWAELPEDDRPALYLYGLSLGSMGVESVLSSVSIVNEPVDGALMVGPPFLSAMHSRLEAGRDGGSPASLPVYEDGRTVRFTDERGGLERGGATWGPTRLAYLQHASDPVVFFSTNLAFDEPEWLADGQRGADVSPGMGWFPVLTMWQGVVGLPSAGVMPDGYGHMYSSTANLRAWAAVTRAPGWTPAREAAISAALAPS